MFDAAERKVSSLRKQPSSFAPGPSGVSRLFSQARRKAEGSISYNYRFHIVTRFLKQITDVIFFSNRRISEQDVLTLSGLQIILRGIIWLCLARTGNYQIHEFDWLKRILTAV